MTRRSTASASVCDHWVPNWRAGVPKNKQIQAKGRRLEEKTRIGVDKSPWHHVDLETLVCLENEIPGPWKPNGSKAILNWWLSDSCLRDSNNLVHSTQRVNFSKKVIINPQAGARERNTVLGRGVADGVSI